LNTFAIKAHRIGLNFVMSRTNSETRCIFYPF